MSVGAAVRSAAPMRPNKGGRRWGIRPLGLPSLLLASTIMIPQKRIDDYIIVTESKDSVSYEVLKNVEYRNLYSELRIRESRDMKMYVCRYCNGGIFMPINVEKLLTLKK